MHMQKLIYATNIIAILGGCQPKDSPNLLQKSVGDSIKLRCNDDVNRCPGTTYVYYHNSSITGQPKVVHQGSHIFSFTINTLDDVGEYFCAKQCTEDIIPASDCQCYWNVIGRIMDSLY